MNSIFLVFIIIFCIISIFCIYNLFYLYPIYYLIKFNKYEFLGFKKITGIINSDNLVKSYISKKSVVYNQIYFEEYIINNSVGGDGERVYSWNPINFNSYNNDFSIITKDKKSFQFKSFDIDKSNFLVDNKEIGIIKKKQITKMKLTNFLNENNVGSSKIKTFELGTKRCIEKYLEPKKEVSIIFKKKDKLIYITDKGVDVIFEKINKSFRSSLILGAISIIIVLFLIII